MKLRGSNRNCRINQQVHRMSNVPISHTSSHGKHFNIKIWIIWDKYLVAWEHRHQTKNCWVKWNCSVLEWRKGCTDVGCTTRMEWTWKTTKEQRVKSYVKKGKDATSKQAEPCLCAGANLEESSHSSFAWLLHTPASSSSSITTLQHTSLHFFICILMLTAGILCLLGATPLAGVWKTTWEGGGEQACNYYAVLNNRTESKLVEIARQDLMNSYAPYSRLFWSGISLCCFKINL